MADIHDVVANENKALEAANLLDEEAPIAKTLALGFSAVAYSIIALGVRLDYVLRDLENRRMGGL